MSSVDGRLLSNQWTELFNGTPTSDLLQVYAAIGSELGTEAWMFGKNTLRAIFPYKFGVTGHSVNPIHRRYLSGSAVQNVCLSLLILRVTFTLLPQP